MKKHLLFFVLLFFSWAAVAQRYTEKKKGWYPAIEGGYSRQHEQHRIDGQYLHLRAKRWMVKKDSTEEKLASLFWGPSAGLMGFVNDKNTFRLGQQLGFTVIYNNVHTFIPLGLKGGVYLENYTKKDQRISLCGGPLLLGIFHFQYGYSIPLGRQTIPGIGRHRIGLLIYLNSIGLDEFLERTPMM